MPQHRLAAIAVLTTLSTSAPLFADAGSVFDLVQKGDTGLVELLSQ